MTQTAFLSIVAIHLAAAISPGPSFVVSVRTAAAEGFRTAAALALGFGLGALLWAAVAMAGLALLLEAFPALLAGIRLVGAAFLIWIAVMLWRNAAGPIAPQAAPTAPRSAAAAVRLGFLTFATNPKPAIFFGAVFAGLVPTDTPTPWKAAILLAVFVNETGWYLLTARLFSLPRARSAYIGARAWIDRAFGALIAAFGIRIALT